MKDLIIDIGNTRIKVAEFEDAILKQVEVMTAAELIQFLDKNLNYKNKFYSSSANPDGKTEQMLLSSYGFSVLNRQLELPFQNAYKSPETLGVDRLALAAAAIKLYPNSNVLIIDAGTCITYDLVNAKGIYLGGAISPGISMRYMAMNHYTAGLPLLKLAKVDKLIGSTTEECMNIGVEKGVVFEIDAMIKAYELEFDKLNIVLTGGDTFHLAGQLKNSIFANPNFILEGLECIMTYNL
ncbi:type III pantothenate kinase [Flavobacteriaceae bacterium]|nr:type III pantothenate kinase [Flavobacteriaceae bacterium]